MREISSYFMLNHMKRKKAQRLVVIVRIIGVCLNILLSLRKPSQSEGNVLSKVDLTHQ